MKIIFIHLDKDYDRVMTHPNPKKKGVVILGDLSCKEGFGIGQFVNDAAKPEICDNDNNFISALKSLEKYRAQSITHVNCEINNNLWFVALKDIEPSEEIFTHYGFEFWVHKFLQESRTPESKLLLYSLHDQAAKPFNLRNFTAYDDDTCKNFLTVLLGISEESLNNYKNSKDFLFEIMETLNIMNTKT